MVGIGMDETDLDGDACDDDEMYGDDVEYEAGGDGLVCTTFV